MSFLIQKWNMRLITTILSWLMVVSLGRLALGHGRPLQLDGTSGALVPGAGLALGAGYAGMAFDPSDEAGLDFGRIFPGST